MGADPIVLSFYDSIIRQSDVDILEGPHWLTDNLIGFYFEYLSNVAYKDEARLLFIGPEVTQCLKVSRCQELGVFLDPLQVEKRTFVFLPVNDCTQVESPGGSHWSLLVFCKNEDSFFHFDSSSGSNYGQAKQLASKLSKFLSASEAGVFVQADTLQQKNGYDCGIHVLCNVDLIAEYCANHNRVEGCGLVKQSEVLNKRIEVLNLIFHLKEEMENESGKSKNNPRPTSSKKTSSAAGSSK
ncbi:sentrin-specific protease 8 [Frankliniella occidentalis]|uniref:Sentrin-specific protease 8 n=1 Tax=Frankliniella occidentalis TaxID=133901 RepID=A0A6J1STW0_FRAOC|nr:sentrin-specific protease 8 [Frankliniella occidentalis]